MLFRTSALFIALCMSLSWSSDTSPKNVNQFCPCHSDNEETVLKLVGIDALDAKKLCHDIIASLALRDIIAPLALRIYALDAKDLCDDIVAASHKFSSISVENDISAPLGLADIIAPLALRIDALGTKDLCANIVPALHKSSSINVDTSLVLVDTIALLISVLDAQDRCNDMAEALLKFLSISSVEDDIIASLVLRDIVASLALRIDALDAKDLCDHIVATFSKFSSISVEVDSFNSLILTGRAREVHQLEMNLRMKNLVVRPGEYALSVLKLIHIDAQDAKSLCDEIITSCDKYLSVNINADTRTNSIILVGLAYEVNPLEKHIARHIDV